MKNILPISKQSKAKRPTNYHKSKESRKFSVRMWDQSTPPKQTMNQDPQELGIKKFEEKKKEIGK